MLFFQGISLLFHLHHTAVIEPVFAPLALALARRAQGEEMRRRRAHGTEDGPPRP